jgi:hypothetical protein
VSRHFALSKLQKAHPRSSRSGKSSKNMRFKI